MKILFVTTVSSTVNAFLIPHIKFLIERGNDVGVAFNKEEGIRKELFELGCRIHHVEFQRNPINKDNLFAYMKIKEIISKEGYRLVHVHTPVASFLTRLACRNMNQVKILYTAHGFHFFKGAPIRNWAIYHTLEKIAARWTDGLITMNDEDFHYAKRFKLRNNNSVYKVNGVGLDLCKFLPQTTEKKMRLRKEYGYNLKDFTLIYVGELSYRKHQDLLIDAVGILRREIPNIRLLLVGEGDRLKEYKDLAAELNVDKNIDFLGFRDDIHNLMSMSDIAVSTSRQEGLPVNVMEAMATGLPLVVTNCRGNRDLVSRGDNGFLIGTEDVEACAQAIEKLYLSEELRRKFAENSMGVIQKYSIDNVIKEMGEIYEEFYDSKGVSKDYFEIRGALK